MVYANIELGNPSKPELEAITTWSLVDTEVLFLCIPAHIALRLQLNEYEKREVMVADGTRKLCPYVGPIHIKYLHRMCLTGALVLGDSVLLGAIPIQDMDLVIHPANLSLTVNPDNPNIAGGLVMSAGSYPFKNA